MKQNTRLTKAALQALAQERRIAVLKTLHSKGTGHWGGSSSVAEILAALYFERMQIDPERPDWPQRDRLILSKGHAAPMLYAMLEKRGYLPEGTLSTLRDINSTIQGHPCMRKTPGVDFSTGALGHGLSAGLGMSLMAQHTERPYCTYVVSGEGCLNEGQTWEAVMAAGKFKPSHLVLMIDYNKVQLDGMSDDIMPLDPLPDKFRAFNWKTTGTFYDGHDIESIRKAFSWLDSEPDGPKVIFFSTIKGKGVSFMENKNIWHGSPVKDEHLAEALPQLEAGLAYWEGV